MKDKAPSLVPAVMFTEPEFSLRNAIPSLGDLKKPFYLYVSVVASYNMLLQASSAVLRHPHYEGEKRNPFAGQAIAVPIVSLYGESEGLRELTVRHVDRVIDAAEKDIVKNGFPKDG